MRLIKKELKNVTHNKKFLFLFSLLFILMAGIYGLYFVIGDTYTNQISIINHDVFRFVHIYLYFTAIVFCFISFEYFYLPVAAEIKESVEAHKNARLRVMVSKICAMCIPAFCFIAVTFILQFCIVQNLDIYAKQQYFSYVSRVYLLSFLRCILGIVAGAVIGSIENKKIGYICLFAAIFLTSPLANSIYTGFSNMLGLSNSISKYFCLYYFEKAWEFIATYGANQENHMFYVNLFWLFFAGGLLWYNTVKNALNKALKISWCVFAIPVILFAYLTVSPGGVFLADAAVAIENNYHYYSDAQLEYKAANFQVLSYDLQMEIKKQLKGEAKIQISNPNKTNQFEFTLYHTLKVTSVTTEDGLKVEFEQSGDYLTISVDQPMPAYTFCVNYKGSLDVLPATDQGIVLLGTFPYYPIEGKHILYDMNMQCVNPLIIEKEKTFTVKIDHNKEVFSGLNTHNGVYSGVVTSPTFISGVVSEENFHNSKILVDTRVKSALNQELETSYTELQTMEAKGYFETNYLNWAEKTLF